VQQIIVSCHCKGGRQLLARSKVSLLRPLHYDRSSQCLFDATVVVLWRIFTHDSAGPYQRARARFATRQTSANR